MGSQRPIKADWLEHVFLKASPSYTYINQSDPIIGKHVLNKFHWNIEKHFASTAKTNAGLFPKTSKLITNTA